jgi:integrase
MEVKLRQEARMPPGEIKTLADALTRFRDEVSPTRRGARWETVRINAFLNSGALPLSLPLARLHASHLAVWRDLRRRSVKPGTVLREMGFLSTLLETARREWGWLEKNPLADVRRPSAPPHRDRLISRAEIRAMLRVMGYAPGVPVRSVTQACAVCFLVALRTGMRAGELCALTWGQVHDGYCHLPVTKTVPRDVPLTLKALRLIHRMRGWDDALVFGLHKNSLSALFAKYRKRAGLSGFTFHDARHTAATWIAGRMRSNNLPAQQALLDLCKMFGWSNLNQSLTYYNPSAAEIARRIG